MGTFGGGCFICDGPVDLTHPEVADAKMLNLENHHGGGIYVTFGDPPVPVLVAVGTLQMEWSEGWGSDPNIVARLVANKNTLLKALEQPTYDNAIATPKDV